MLSADRSGRRHEMRGVCWVHWCAVDRSLASVKARYRPNPVGPVPGWVRGSRGCSHPLAPPGRVAHSCAACRDRRSPPHPRSASVRPGIGFPAMSANRVVVDPGHCLEQRQRGRWCLFRVQHRPMLGVYPDDHIAVIILHCGDINLPSSGGWWATAARHDLLARCPSRRALSGTNWHNCPIRNGRRRWSWFWCTCSRCGLADEGQNFRPIVNLAVTEGRAMLRALTDGQSDGAALAKARVRTKIPDLRRS